MARSCSTSCLPIDKDAYLGLIEDPRRFRGWLAQAFRSWPELFPKDFASLTKNEHIGKDGAPLSDIAPARIIIMPPKDPE